MSAPGYSPSTPILSDINDTSATMTFDIYGIAGSPDPTFSIEYSDLFGDFNIPATLVSGTIYTATATSLIPGTMYDFRSAASNSYGYMVSQSLTVSTTGTSPAPNQPPTIPLTTSVNDTSITMTFDVDGIIGSPEPTYSIEYSDVLGNYNIPAGIVSGTIYTATATSLLPGTSYTFKSSATNIYGNVTSELLIVSTTGVSPAPNQAPTVPISTSVNDTSITMTFDIDGITGSPVPTFSIKYLDFLGNYDIPASLVSGTIYTATATSLIPGTSYEFRSAASNIHAVTESGLLTVSTTGVSPAPNKAPTDPVITSTSETSVTVTFDVAGITGDPVPTFNVIFSGGLKDPDTVSLFTFNEQTVEASLQSGTIWTATRTDLVTGLTYTLFSQAINTYGFQNSAEVTFTASVPTYVAWDPSLTYIVGSVVIYNGIIYICHTYAPTGYGPYGGYLDGTAPGYTGIIYWKRVASYPTTTGPNPTATPSVAKAQAITYKKVVCWGLNPNVVNFATAGTLGHRVCVSIPVDIMNAIFVWSRASGELAPTGRLANVHANGSSPLQDALVTAMQGGFNDMDGVSAGLNFSSTATDMAGDLKRDPSIYNAASRVTDGVSTTHYGANDLVVAYLMFKCFGSSSYDPTAVIYNIDDAFNMLSSEELADAITASLEAEDALANACVLPNGKAVAQQLAGDNKGLVDSMFRAFLAADPLRYFLNGVQIPGLFETNFVSGTPDPSVGGNWCLTVGDKLEIPLQLVFRAEVNVLSVQDNVQNPSSNTPDSANTNIIKGEAANFNSASKADKSNIIPIRLQLLCSAPVGSTTGGTSGVQLPLQIAASAPVIFYTPANYGVQNALAAAAAGGVSPYTYSFGVKPTDLPSVAQGLSINSATGLVTFKAAVATTSVAYDLALVASNAATSAATADPTNPTKAAAATTAAAATVAALNAMNTAGGASGVLAVTSGKYSVPIIITDSANPVGTVTVNVNMTFDDGAGSSNANLPAAGSGGGSGSTPPTTITITEAMIVNGGTYETPIIPGNTYTVVNARDNYTDIVIETKDSNNTLLGMVTNIGPATYSPNMTQVGESWTFVASANSTILYIA